MMEPRHINNPFPGLRPFETDEYRLFFGREGQSDELLARLQRSRFLAVVGTSGSGKSSLIRAGLLPALRGGLMAGAGSGWRIAVMRPGGDPIGNLAWEFAKEDVLMQAGAGLPPSEAEAVIDATLRTGSLGVVDVARQARLAEHEKLLIVVDQFEELFRFRSAVQEKTSTGDQASAFVKLLLEASQQREIAIYVVLTMRSDFLGDCSQFQGLPEAINDGQYLIPRMTRDERRFAVTGPVGVTRGKITEPLVNRLLNDVGDNPDQLPILQHALMRTWDHWASHRRNGEPIGLEHYEAVGTMSDALSRHADEALAELDERGKVVAELLFKALTERGADNREIRRPTSLQDICAITNATAAEVVSVIDVFRGAGRSFLMPPAGVALKPETVIDISHESLIRNWDRLRAWVDDEAQSARIYRRLADAATDYYQKAGGLLDDVTLRYVLRWRERIKPEWAWGVRYHPDFNTAMAYLELSSLSADARIEAEQERERRELETTRAFAEKQERAARRLRLLAIGMGVMFLLALGTAVVAFSARRHARQSEREALALRDDAVKQQQVIASLLEREKGEKQKAREAEDAAERQAAIADVEKRKAVLASQAAVAALAQAQQQTKVAKAEKIKADEQRVIAEQEVKKNKRAREANDHFRDGVAYAQRGDYDNASMLLKEAIEGYEDPLVSNREAVADAETQRGNFIFNIAHARFIQENGHLDERAMHDVQFFSSSFDRAASIYAEAPVNSPQKAAAALFTLGTMLLKLTKDDPAGDGRNRAALAELIEASSLDRPVPTLGFFSGRAGGQLSQQSDLSRKRKAEIEGQAVERYQKALEYYRKAGDHEGQTKTSFQLGDFYMKKANFIAIGHGDLSLIGPSRQQAIQYFEQLLSPNATGPDPSRVRLLVWLGGLHQQVGNQPVADRYFGRAIETYQRDASWAKGGLAEIASIAEEAGQMDIASVYYAKAVAAFEAAGDLPLQAKTLYSLGRVHEKLNEPGAFDRAIQYYRQAVKTDVRANQINKESKGDLEELLRVGAVAEEIGDYRLALDAYGMALTSAGDSQSDRNRLGAARAHSEIGSVLSATNEPTRALESYERSLAIYKSLLDYRNVETRNAAKIEMQRVRKMITALLQTVPTK